MYNFKFYPADLHGWFWDAIEKTGYADALRMRTREQEQMTVDMLNCALFHIFKSVEHVENYTPEILLSQYINPEQLFEMMKQRGEMKPVREIIERTFRANEYDPTSPLYTMPVIITTRPTDIELAYTAYYQAYATFRDKIELMIRRVTGDSFSRFFMVKLNIVADGHERVRAIDLYLHGDIRHKFFMEHFPDGRFDSGKGGGD